MASFGNHPFYEASRPLPAEDGIAARSRHGAIGETWWSRRFIELLESFGVGSRLKRGRNYARSGQVVELDVEHGVVLAKVQGSRHSPYRVRIRYRPLIEELFHSCKLSLFPCSQRELNATCTCPDGVNPCKHIAAAYYILAERFDENPFLIFTWRGRDQDELMESLRKRRVPAGRGARTSTTSAPAANVPEPGASLSTVLDSFWSCGPELEGFHVSPLAGEAPDALLRQLGPAPVEVGEHNLAEILADAYVTLAHAAERRALSE
jgi:uncharacterized Zn finger protein